MNLNFTTTQNWIPHNSTSDSLIQHPTTYFHSLCETLFVDIIPHNSTKKKFIPRLLPLFHIIININSTQFHVDEYCSTYAHICSTLLDFQFHAWPSNVELCGINFYSTQLIPYSTRKKFIPRTYFLFHMLINVWSVEKNIFGFIRRLVFLFHAGQFYSTQFHAKCGQSPRWAATI